MLNGHIRLFLDDFGAHLSAALCQGILDFFLLFFHHFTLVFFKDALLGTFSEWFRSCNSYREKLLPGSFFHLLISS